VLQLVNRFVELVICSANHTRIGPEAIARSVIQRCPIRFRLLRSCEGARGKTMSVRGGLYLHHWQLPQRQPLACQSLIGLGSLSVTTVIEMIRLPQR